MPNTTTSDVTSVTEGEVYVELGGWWLVPHANLVVRGRFAGIVDRYEIGDTGKEIWALDVIDVLLGSTNGSATLMVAHVAFDETAAGLHENQLPWARGDEGIFFLVPVFGSDAVPDLYVASHGSIGVITEDLEHWSAHLPRAREALATLTFFSAPEATELVLARQTEVIAEGTVATISPPGEVLGWDYLRIHLGGVTEVWSPGPEPPPEEGVPPPLPSELDFIVSADGEGVVSEGDRLRVMLRTAALPEPVGPTWLVVGGWNGFLDSGVSPEVLASDMDRVLAGRGDYFREARERALEILRPIAADAGRIPLISDPVPVVEPVDMTPLYRSPLTIEKDGVVIVFDRWFFALLDGMAQVTVTTTDGRLLTGGPVEGPYAIMRELPDSSFEFVNEDGDVVATLTQSELSNAATLAHNDFTEQAAP
ncbi:MAG: hypothetical protein WD269_06410 [Acidimicrobiia bacterium]